MDIRGNTLVFEPREHAHDLRVLRVIDKGLGLRRSGPDFTQVERILATRVGATLDLARAGHPQEFPISVVEAWAAGDAIRANTDAELIEHNGRLHEADSIIASQEAVHIRDFAEQSGPPGGI